MLFFTVQCQHEWQNESGAFRDTTVLSLCVVITLCVYFLMTVIMLIKLSQDVYFRFKSSYALILVRLPLYFESATGTRHLPRRFAERSGSAASVWSFGGAQP